MSNLDQREYVSELVREALSKKEQAERQREVEKLLETSQNTIQGLNETVVSKDQELAIAEEAHRTLTSQSSELAEKVTSLGTELAEAKKKTEEYVERATAAEKELADIATAARLADRMVELEEAKVASSSEDSRNLQKARIAGLSDEEFAAYKSELVDMRTQLENSFKEDAAAAKVAAEQKTEEELAAEKAAVAEAKNKKEESAAAAAASTLNIEVASEDIKNKYLRLGRALAAARVENSQ